MSHGQTPCSRRPRTRTAEGAESPPRVSKLLTTDKVAEIIRLSPETFAQWRWLRKEILFIRIGPKCVRYGQCDDAWIEKRLVPVSCRLASPTKASGTCRRQVGRHRECPRNIEGWSNTRVSIFACESKQAGLALRRELFAEAMLENSLTKPPRRVDDFVVSAATQLLFLAVLLLLPLYFSEAIDIHQFNKTLLAAPPPAPAPPLPPTSARSVAPKRRRCPWQGS